MSRNLRIKRGAMGAALRNKLRRAVSNKQMANLAVYAWRQAVNSSMLSPRAKIRYKNAITPYASRPGAYVKEKIAKLLETGWRPFDMKPGLLKGKLMQVIPIATSGGTVFRTVSAKSSPSSWQHPGFEGAKVIDQAKERFKALLLQAVSWNE